MTSTAAGKWGFVSFTAGIACIATRTGTIGDMRAHGEALLQRFVNPRGRQRVNNAWTTGELRKLAAVHEQRQPSLAELTEMFPRHPPMSIITTAQHRGHRNANTNFIRWMRIAHEYFAKRESEMHT
jgi:hypothetical protein